MVLPEGCFSRVSFPDRYSALPNAAARPPNLQSSACIMKDTYFNPTVLEKSITTRHGGPTSRYPLLVFRIVPEVVVSGSDLWICVCWMYIFMSEWWEEKHLRVLTSSVVSEQLTSAADDCFSFKDSSCSSTCDKRRRKWAQHTGDCWVWPHILSGRHRFVSPNTLCGCILSRQHDIRQSAKTSTTLKS